MPTIVSYKAAQELDLSALTPAQQDVLASLLVDDIAGKILSIDAGNEMALGADGLLYSHDFPTREELTVTGTNALTPLSVAPTPPESVNLEVNGVTYLYEDGAFTIAGTIVTWDPLNASTGFDLEVGDTVYAIMN